MAACSAWNPAGRRRAWAARDAALFPPLKAGGVAGFEVYRPDVVIYDVLGDGLRRFPPCPSAGYARECSSFPRGDVGARRQQHCSGYPWLRQTRLRGAGAYHRNAATSRGAGRSSAGRRRKSADVVAYIPAAASPQHAEAGGGTVFECLKDSPMRAVYEDLAGRVLDLTHDEKGEQQVC